MKATQVRTLRRLVVAWAALSVSIAVPVAVHAQFPAFTPMAGVTPEGVAVDKTGNVYVSVRTGTDGLQGVIRKYTPEGESSLFCEGFGAGSIGGLAVSPNGVVFAAVAAGAGQGVYRVDQNGTAERLPGTEQIVMANGLAFEPSGTLYVTESYSGGPGAYGQGGIWRIPPGGEATLWLRHSLLSGIGYLGYPVGANGIAFYHRDLYVANTDKAMVVRIPVLPDGAAGQPAVWKAVEPVAGLPPIPSPLPPMPDGLALDVHGNVYLAVVSRNSIVRIRAEDLVQETVTVMRTPWPDLFTRAPIDTPASLAFGTGAGEQQNLFIANLGWTVAMAPPGTGPYPGPGIVKVDAGFPGRPLY